MTKKKDQPLNNSFLPSDILANQKVEDNPLVQPNATNEMASEEVFVERTEYKTIAYPYGDEQVPTPIDIWYHRGLYGKVDTHYNPVFVDEKHLKKLPSEQGDVFALNFVVDAFSDLQNHMRIAANEGRIFIEDTKFLALEPKRGWTSVQNRYYEHVSALYSGFADTYLEGGRKKEEMLNFKDFMKLFQEYLKTIQPDFPFTRTGFITSQMCPITTTGIVIELDLANHGNDRVKYEDYIGDPNFVFYTRAARQFGFWVDKNAPWRLVADLKSSVMQKYMSRYPEPPVEPPLSGSQPMLPEPCAPEWFGNFKNQKVQFTLNGEAKIGYIADLVDCANPQTARFKIQEVVDELEIDLLQSSDLVVPQALFVEGPQSSLNSDKTQAQIINVASPDSARTGQAGTGGQSATTYRADTLDNFRWLTAPLPESRNGQSLRESVEKYYDVGALGTSFARRFGLGAFKPGPIHLSAAGSHINGSSGEIKSYQWTVLEDANVAEANKTQFFLSPDVSQGPISPQDLTGTDIYILPTRSGPHTIELKLKDRQGNIRKETFTLTLNVCTLGWEDTARKFSMTPDVVEAFGPDWVYTKLKAEVEAVWDEWNAISDRHYDNWLGAIRNPSLRRNGMETTTNRAGTTLARSSTSVPRTLISVTSPVGMGPDRLFPFPFKKQETNAQRRVSGARPQLASTIGPSTQNPLCADGSASTDQFPETGELEFLRPRLGWDIIGKHRFLTSWIKYLVSNEDGSRNTQFSPRLLTQKGVLGQTPPTWDQIMNRAEIGPDIYDHRQSHWTPQTLWGGTQKCLHQFVYNQWQARAGSFADSNAEVGPDYSFAPMPLFGSCEAKIERYELSSNAALSSGYPVKNYPFRNGGRYQEYRVPRTHNLSALSAYEKGLDDDLMGDVFGGALADLFEVMLIISSQLLGGVRFEELTNNVTPPSPPIVAKINGQNVEHWKTDYHVAFAREPFSGMGIVPFYWYSYQPVASGTGASSGGTAGVDDSTNLSFLGFHYRSDFVIRKIDFRGAYRRLLNGRQWNDHTLLNGRFTPYETWRTNVYRRSGESYLNFPQRSLFMEDPRFTDITVPWAQGATNQDITPVERDEIIRYLISLDPSDGQDYADMLLFVLSVASDRNCGQIAIPTTSTPAKPRQEEPALTTFETEAFYYDLGNPLQPSRLNDWRLSYGDVDEYLNKREEYSQAIMDHPRLLEEWRLRKVAYEKWITDYARWRELPRLKFDNLYLHAPPFIDSPGEYIRSFESDIAVLQNYTLDFYNSYVAQNRILVTREFNDCGDGTVQTVHRRELLSENDFMNIYDELFWLRFYFTLRVSESGRLLTLGEERALMNQIQNLYSKSLQAQKPDASFDALERIAMETNGVYVKGSDPITQGTKPDIINKFKKQTKENSLTLQDLYANVLPDGSFKP